MSLVAAAVSALFVLSAVIAVRGWPDIAPAQQPSAPVVLSEVDARDDADGADPAGPAPIVLASSEAPASARDRRAAGPREPSRRPGAPSPSTPATGPAAPAPAAEGGNVTDPVTDRIGDPTRPADEVADPVAPGTGGVVGETTGVTGDSVASAGEGVAGVVEPIAPRTGRAIEEVTGAVGQTVSDAGAAVDDALTGLLGALAPPLA